ncbi:uncharacterized protein LOC124159801 [Ischnura elegans]|uniref:uncharacterized protein LOC124159801 n=1 Tax=Ischnura elegans TaxID=197161 RepID=UPI001ED8A533|nr:uncharacterized protein LOC124159801 [Ischnura elegans]
MEFLVREEDCRAAIQSYLGSNNFILEDYKVKPAGSKHVGFMGRHYILTAAVHHAGELNETHMFVKLPPITVAHRNLVLELKLLQREYTVYSYLVPLLKSSLPPSTKLPIPKCFLLRDTVHPDAFPAPGSEDEEIIILEDVTRLGFKPLQKCPLLDLPHCRVVMKTLAKFHAASILYEHTMAEDDRKSRDSPDSEAKEERSNRNLPFLDDLWEFEAAETVVAPCVVSVATAAAEIWPERFFGERETVSETLREAWQAMRRDFSEHPRVMCHGDLWANNLMFAYDGQDPTIPVDCLMVDLQKVSYCPPVTDILLFLHSSTTRQFRDENAESLLDYYHYKLGEIVGTELLDEVLPLSAFLQSYADLRMLGLVLSTAYLPVILEENDDLLSRGKLSLDPLDVKETILKDRGERIASNCKASKAYAERIMECFQECFESLGLWD